MNQLCEGIHEVYDTRERFIIIGLTGRTGSGCSTTARILSTTQKKLKLVMPKILEGNKNEARKYAIINMFAEHNWHHFITIEIKNIITSFILEIEKDKFADYFSKILEPKNEEKRKRIVESFIKVCGNDYDSLRAEQLKLTEIADITESHKRCKKYYFEDLPPFTEKLKKNLASLSSENYTKVFQLIGDNIRSSGNAISSEFSAKNIFAISDMVNKLIKIFRYEAKKNRNTKTLIVIDALRNPFEALFFRERYSAFYLMALNTNDSTRKDRLQSQYDLSVSEIEKIDKKESNKIKTEFSDFVSQNIQKCYDIADVHVSNPQIGLDDFTFLKWQIVKFVALIMRPGIIMPSSGERCMQIAHTAKLNSGCLSRQVGACITNESYSVKAIGWNTPPEGQTPCSLRNVYDLFSHKDDSAFSHYENNDKKFKELTRKIYDNDTTKNNLQLLKGRNVSYCFKDIKNQIDQGKNQVHTRSLHGEENAFLQIVKYGGQGIKGGKLFTTSSPCELCAKKAYQLGITEIFYIDPYPGISESHILNSGPNMPKLTMFSGAIGRAYHHLYEPIMPKKDEISAIIQVHLKDYHQELEEENEKLKVEILRLKARES